MGKIVWKSFWHNWKNFTAFFISIMLSVTVLFLLVYLGQAAGTVTGIETDALAFAYRSELKGQIRSVIPVMILITVMVIGYSVQFYIQSRMKDYGMFRILGIQRKDMRSMVILEYTLGCGIACAVGLLSGKMGTMLLGSLLSEMAGQSFAAGISMGRVYIYTALLCAAMTVGALIAVFMAADARGMTGLLQRSSAKEKRLDTPRSVLYFFLGAGVIAGGFFMVGNEPMMAHIAVSLVCAGVAVIFFAGLGYMLERFRVSMYYRRHILTWDHTYHYWKRHRSRMVIQILLGILAIYFSFLMLRGTLHDRQMPNDFVCISEEGKEKVFLDKMRADFGAECVSFPFVWVNEPGGDSWIGMSVSDYKRVFSDAERQEDGDGSENAITREDGDGTENAITREGGDGPEKAIMREGGNNSKNAIMREGGGELDLADGEVFRVWRQEGSRESMLDNSGTKRLEAVTLGRCTNTDWDGEMQEEACNFRIKGERIEELLGFSLAGVAVLPDETVKEAADKGDFHQVLMIINVDGENLKGATAFTEEQKEEGVLGEAFCRRTIEGIDRKESVINRMLVGITVGVIVLFGMFVIWLMHFSEMDEKRARYRFLRVLGMEKRWIRRVMDAEILRAVLMPVVLAAGLAGGFCRVFLETYYEGAVGEKAADGAGNLAAQYTDEWLLLVILAVYAAGEIGFCVLNQVWCNKQLEKE